MNQLTSPDWPAYDCYLLVLLLGLWSAAAHINRLLDSTTDRWGFMGTWALFFAHMGVPLALFWFLDYTNALHDTSLFAAIVVAVGYRQIFAGGVQGIMMPGETAALWKPFEFWVDSVRGGIVMKTKVWRDRLNEKLRDHFGSDDERLGRLRRVTFKYSSAPTKLDDALKALIARPKPALLEDDGWNDIQKMEQVKILLVDLRSSVPSNYGFFLVKDGLLSNWQYRWWLGDARARRTAWYMSAILTLVVLASCIGFHNSQTLQYKYYLWRFAKTNATAKDRFRTCDYIGGELKKNAYSFDQAALLIGPLMRSLRYKELPTELSGAIIEIVMTCHSRGLDSLLIPRLVDALRTENLGVRQQVHQTLKDLQAADFSSAVVDSNLASWKPEQNAPAGETDRHVREWQAWWKQAQMGP